MNLDEYRNFTSVDPGKMLAQIDGLPEQLQEAWKLGFRLELPQMGEIHSVIIAGMGGSAIGADLLAATVSPLCPVPVIVHRNYELPAWAKGRETLAILSSHSGDTEETLSVFDAAVRAHCQIVTISTGGKLLERAQKYGLPAWTFNHEGQPRAAVGFSYGLMLALITRLGLIADMDKDVGAAVNAMKEQRNGVNAEIPLRKNPAKRLAGQLVGRYPIFFSAGHMAPVARRWKTQVNEVAKTIAAFEVLPEANHNTLAGIGYPQEILTKAIAFFIRSESDFPRNKLRFELTQRTMMEEGIVTDSYLAAGKSRMEQIWQAVQFGDYAAYYLAMANETDPSEIPTILELKAAMSE
jgi:glucose/mannose-6-phosphate isomerase